MNHLQDTPVLVLGLGASGLAMARWCARCGASVQVWDSRDEPAHAAALAEHVPEARLIRGALDDAALESVRLVLKSPGLAPHDERIAGALARLAERGVPVQGELDLFARALADLKADCGYAPAVLAITGTNGKTTTTAMAGRLIERAGKRVAMAGNIGPTMLQTLADALDREPVVRGVQELSEPSESSESSEPDRDELAELRALDGAAANEVFETSDAMPDADSLDAEASVPLDLAPPPPPLPVFEVLPEVWVLELSSFQLDRVEGFEPSAAALLNLSEDHLDWHGSMANYVAAKARIFGKAAVMVINRDDPQVEALVPVPVPVPAVVKGGGRSRKPVAATRSVVRFGTDAPRHPGDFGLVEENGMTWLVRARELDETLQRGKGGKGRLAEPEALSIQRLMPADALRVRGRHNAANALAALALATAIGCPLAPMLHGLREFTGEPHRVQYIATLDGVDAFDDSKGTNVGATVAALNGLGADKDPARLVVILGGDGKGQDFRPLAEPVRRHARAVATIGRDAGRIEAVLADTGIAVQRHATLQAATRWSFEQARGGDAVLLSPACASLDMFAHYGERAAVFVAEVHAIVADRGGLSA